MAKAAGVLRLVQDAAPSDENGKVSKRPPRRVRNIDRRAREYLTEQEVGQLMRSARSRGRWGTRDGALILIAFRHGLRVSELVALRWEQIDFYNQTISVVRKKNGKPGVHPLPGDEIRILRKLKGDAEGSQYVFNSERGAPLTASSVRYIVAKAGVAAAFPFPVHPHQLRHACGYKLAQDGNDTRLIQDFLGHRSITHTVRYTELDPARYRNINWGSW